MSEKIDAHHHFWKYDPDEYDWIDDGMRAIRRDFLPEDFEAEIAAAGINGVVSVQARQTVEETQWLLELADARDFIRGVVGWAPLVSPGVAGDLERLARNKKLRAVRHVLQGEADEHYMLRQDFNAGIEALRGLGLVYDILILERHLPQTIEFVDRHPDQVFVLDHIAKPRIRENVLSPWRENITELAKREHLYCKLSGMVTEADYEEWTEEQLRPYLETVLTAFGPDRLMFGSDWPVCLVACRYGKWHGIVSSFIATLSVAEQERILGGTATEAYKL
ncbi:MAG: amidohydrolase family protein [Armatimonadota bacterium]|jgi:L-fuconolactonase